MNFRLTFKKKWLILSVTAVFLVVCSVAGIVYAKYVTNQSEEAEVDIIAVGELNVAVSGDGTYTITNVDSSNIPAYIRAAVVVNWRDGDGNLWAIPPVENVDYTVSYPECTKIGNYYYYNGTRYPNEGFNITVSSTGTTNPGYVLDVKIIAEGIQCVPDNAAQYAWGAMFNGTIWAITTP